MKKILPSWLYLFLVKTKNSIFSIGSGAKKKRQEENLLSFYSTIIKPNDLVFDIGANVGNRSDIFLQLGAKVVAIEPQPNCVAELQVRFNDRIIIEPVGLAKESGEMDMYIADESTISTFSKDVADILKSTRFSRNEWNEIIKVKVTTLNDIIEKYGIPRFCKIDVEGFELEVLSGLKKAVPALSFEYCVPELKSNLMNCLACLNELESTFVYNYSIEESMKYALTEWVSYQDFIKICATPNFDSTLFGDVYVKQLNKN